MQAAGEPSAIDAAGPLVASQQDLETFASQPGTGLNDAMRGVLAETALTGYIRYDWQLLKPLCHALIDSILGEFAAEEQVEVGPPRPMPGGGSLESMQSGLHGLLDGFAEAPFTLQRLCELLLEPRKQYRKLDKLAAALEKLLLVTSTCPRSANLPPRPTLSSLGPVNNNPPSQYMPHTASDSSAQQAQQQLPNGRDAPSDSSPSEAARTGAVFRMFMGTAGGGSSSAASGSGGIEAGGAAQLDEGSGAGSDMSAADAAEAELAKRFVEDALRTDPEPGGEEVLPGAQAGRPPASADGGSAPAGAPAQPQQGVVSPTTAGHSEEQWQPQPGVEAAGPATRDATMPAVPASGEGGAAAMAAVQQEDQAAAMEIDAASGAEQGPLQGAEADRVAGALPQEGGGKEGLSAGMDMVDAGR